MVIKRDTDVWELYRDHVPDFEELAGVEELLPQQPSKLHNTLARTDVLHVRGMGGGGFGDPVARARAAVQADVTSGLVTPARAAEVYRLS